MAPGNMHHTSSPRGRALHHMGYVGMCGPNGYVFFSAILVINRDKVSILAALVILFFCTLVLIFSCMLQLRDHDLVCFSFSSLSKGPLTKALHELCLQ